MTDTGRDLPTRDEDRLPWLEAVEDETAHDGPSALKLILAVIVALIAIGLVVGGVFWLKNREDAPQGDASLIQAPSNPYKVKPSEPGGMKVEGAGDSAYPASEGAETNGAIDLSSMPETALNADRTPPAATPAPAAKTPAAQPAKPAEVAANQPAKPAPQPAKPAAAAKPPVRTAAASAKVPSVATPAPTPKPVSANQRAASAQPAPSAAPAMSGGGTVQLGAFSSEAKANAAWKSLSGRYGFLGGLNHDVTPVTTSGGSTLYRLRAGAGGQAGTVCAKLKVAGETCAVVG